MPLSVCLACVLQPHPKTGAAGRLDAAGVGREFRVPRRPAHVQDPPHRPAIAAHAPAAL